MAEYTPKNDYVYFQAFSGALAGLLGQSTPLQSGVDGYYTDTIAIAGAWAQEVDTLWGTSTNPDQFQNAEIFSFSNDLFEVYEPQPNTGVATAGSSTNPATYAATAAGMFQVLTDAESWLATNAVVPPPLGAGGLNFVRTQNSVEIHSQTQSAANPVALAAIAVQQKANGLWEYDIDVSLASGTTAKTVELKAVLIPFTALPQVFTQSAGSIESGNPEVGPAYAGLAVGELVAQLNQDAAGVTASGLLYGGTACVDTATNAQTLYDKEMDTLTGLLAHGDLAFNAHGEAGYNAAGNQHTGFGVGKWAVLVLELVSTAGGDVVTFASLSMSLREAA
jgi:hypothetical protein